MKKSKYNSKKLPKYEGGGSNFNEFGYNTEDQGQGTSNIYNQKRGSNISSNQYNQAATAIGAGAIQAYVGYTNPYSNDLQKTRSLQSGADTAEIGVAGAVNPILGTAVGAVKKIGNGVQNQVDRTDANGNLINRNDSKVGEVAGGFLDPANSLIGIYSDPKATTGEKVAGALTGGLSDMFTNRHRNQVESNAKNSMFGFGGMKFPNGGVNMLPNAEVEKQENTIAPDGEFTQFDGPSHAQGGIQTNLTLGEMIFSDKLKLGKKTFAQLNKINNTNKQDKVLDNPNADRITKKTAELLRMAKLKNSENLFQQQEDLKQAKVQAYAKRMGVNLDNEQSEPQGQSEQSEGEMKYGGIHIKPSHRGRFTEYLKRSGSTLQEALHSPNAHVRQMANFANNAKHWKHEDGGLQQYPFGGEITPQQYKQAQTDSMTLYKSGLNPQMENYQYPGYNDAYLRLYDVNKESPSSTNNTQTFQGKQYTGATSQFMKPSMLPYVKQPNIPTTQVSPIQVMHPDYNQPISGVPKSNYKFGDGGKKDPNDINALNSRQQQDYQGWFNANSQNEGFNPDEYSVDNYMKQYESRGAELPSNTNSATGNGGQGSNFDWGKLGTQVGLGIANNVGNIYDLSRSNKSEVTKFQRANANLLDPTAALRDATDQTRRAEYNVRGASSGNAGTYLSNRVALNAQNVVNKDRIRQEYANANAGILNQNSQFNTGIANQEYVANEQNRAQTRNIKGQALANIGSNVVSQYRDNKSQQYDQTTLDNMSEFYNALKNDPYAKARWEKIKI